LQCNQIIRSSVNGYTETIVKYLMSLREKGLSYNTLSLSLCAIYHFYEMNDVVLNKKKINMFKGEFKKFVDRS